MNSASGPAEESEDLNLCSDDMAFVESLLEQLSDKKAHRSIKSLENKFDEVLDSAEDDLLGHAPELNFSGPESRNTLRYMLTLNFAEKIFRDYMARKEQEAEVADPPPEWTKEERLNLVSEKLEFVVGEEVERWNTATQGYPHECNIVESRIERCWGFCPPVLWRFESQIGDKEADYRPCDNKARADELRVLWKEVPIASIGLDQLKGSSVPFFGALMDVAHKHIVSWFTHEQFAPLRNRLKDDFPNLHTSLVADSEQWSRANLFRVCKKLVAERISLKPIEVIVQTLLEHSPTDPFDFLAQRIRIALAPHTSRDFRVGMTLPVMTLSPEYEKSLLTCVRAQRTLSSEQVKNVIWYHEKCERPLLVSEVLRLPLMKATKRWDILTQDDIPDYISVDIQRVVHFRGVRKPGVSKRRSVPAKQRLDYPGQRLHRKRLR